MLAKPIEKLVHEIFSFLGEEKEQSANKHPEACLISLLTIIKGDLPDQWTTLRSTIQRAAYEDNVEEARRVIEH